MTLLQKIEEKKAKKLKADRNKKIAIATAGVTTGAVVGAVAGVLLAPKSGKETIEDVKERSNKIKENISGNIELTKGKVNESKLKIKEYLDSKKIKKSIDEIIITDTIESAEETEALEEK